MGCARGGGGGVIGCTVSETRDNFSVMVVFCELLTNHENGKGGDGCASFASSVSA